VARKSIQEIQEITEQHSEQTLEWWGQRKPHVQKAYRNPHTDKITQIPILLDLMRKIGVPHIDKWEQMLTDGFNMMGHLMPGPGWKNRSDQKLSDPWTLEQLREHNAPYIQGKTAQGRVDERWQKMLGEIIADTKLLRMEGPFEAPEWASFKSAKLPAEYELQNQPLKEQDIIIAWAFAILQVGSDGLGKIRRGEDWRRGGQNATTHAFDQPHHHTPDHYVAAGDKDKSL